MKRCIRAVFYSLDEYRLIYLGVDKFGIICYTLVIVKKGDNKNEVYSY